MIALLLCLAAIPVCAQADASDGCRVWLDGVEIAILNTAVNTTRTWTSRPMTTTAPVAVGIVDDPVEVTVQFIGVALESITIRPLSLGITAEIDSDTARFALDGPANVTVEYNGQVVGALHLFLAAPDENRPDVGASGVIYLGPGEHSGIITLDSGDTLYLDEGAVLHGAVRASGVTDVRIAGRGIIDGSGFDRWSDTIVPIDISNAQNVTIEGITILDPSAWTLNLYKSQHVTVDGVKIIGARSNSDGITIQSCEDVLVTNCFVRGWDDNLVVKGYDGDACDITFENCTLWTDLAQSCEIGYETRADVIERITFRDITVLHAFHKPVMSIHNSDNALVRDILFENIIIEDAQMGQGDGMNLLIELTTTRSQWSKAKERGSIRNVEFDGITVLSGNPSGIRIFSAGEETNIDEVTLKNLTLLGEPITDISQLRLNTNRHNGPGIRVE